MLAASTPRRLRRCTDRLRIGPRGVGIDGESAGGHPVALVPFLHRRQARSGGNVLTDLGLWERAAQGGEDRGLTFAGFLLPCDARPIR